MNGITGGYLVPILKQMRELSDAPGAFMNWFERSYDFSFVPEKIARKQPASYKRIVNALRRSPEVVLRKLWRLMSLVSTKTFAKHFSNCMRV